MEDAKRRRIDNATEPKNDGAAAFKETMMGGFLRGGVGNERAGWWSWGEGGVPYLHEYVTLVPYVGGRAGEKERISLLCWALDVDW